jgi:hypothetical protein
MSPPGISVAARARPESDASGPYPKDASLVSEQSNAPENSATSRRTVVGAAAWTVPALAVAIAAPLASASNPVACPTVTQRTGIHLQITTSSLNKDGSCHSGSSVAVQVSKHDEGIPALAVSSDTAGLTAVVSGLELTVTFPYEVKWSTPQAWTVALKATSGFNRTYVFTPAKSFLPTTISVGTPATNWVRAADAKQGVLLPTFSGKAVYEAKNPFFKTDVRVTRDYPWTSTRRFGVDLKAPCDDLNVVNTGSGVLTPVRIASKSRLATTDAVLEAASNGSDAQ